MTRGRPPTKDILTPREWDVLHLLEQGLTNEQIAQRLSISANTSKFHVSEILSKLQVSSRDDAVRQGKTLTRHNHRIVLVGPLIGGLRRLVHANAAKVALAALATSLVAALIFTNLSRSSTEQNQNDVHAPSASPLADFGGMPQTSSAVSFSDPFEYCRAVGTVDRPDGRYTGPLNTPEMVRAVADGSGLPADSPFRIRPPALAWRCADGHVLACSYGANVPCDKANVDRTPTQSIMDWCKSMSTSSAVAIPKSVTGRATVFDWQCVQGQATIIGQTSYVDDQGFPTLFWYPVFQ